MNINAKQIEDLSTSRFDITTVLGFFGQMKDKIAADATLTAAMGPVWTAFTAARQAYDDAYAQTRKWAQTADLETLDKQRDDALSAFQQTLKAMTQSPNAAKQTAAKLLAFIRSKYSLNSSDEYMKETTAISQMIQEIESSAEAQAALQTTGLDDWLTDLKTKNNAFLAKMNERTEAQAGLQKGILREKRLQCEAAYRNVVKLINAMAICEVPAGYSFGTIIDLLNAEIEHYRQILARKGVSSGSSNNNGGGSDDNGGSGSTEQGGSLSEQGSGSSEQGSGSTEQGGSSSEQGSGSSEQGSGSTEQGSSTEQGGGSGDNGGGSGDNGGGGGPNGGGNDVN